MLHSSTVKVCFSVQFCLILYHYTIINDYTRYYICSAWFLVIIISTCYPSGHQLPKTVYRFWNCGIFTDFKRFILFHEIYQDFTSKKADHNIMAIVIASQLQLDSQLVCIQLAFYQFEVIATFKQEQQQLSQLVILPLTKMCMPLYKAT